MRVLVVADNMLSRTGLAALLAGEDSLDIVGQVAAGASLTDDLDIYRPDVVVLDLGYDLDTALPSLDGLDRMPTVVLIAQPDDATLVAAALSETDAYALLLRDTAPTTIASALMTVGDGLVALDPEIATAIMGSVPPPPDELVEGLTPRESEVLQLIAEGLPNKTIALELGISPNTVKFHINAILTKLDAQSRTEAVVRATRLGLIIL